MRAWMVAMVSVALAGCVESYKPFHEPAPPTCVASSERMKHMKDWGHYLPDIYPGLRGCLNAHPAAPAYAGNVVPHKDGTITVYMQGSDGSIYTCLAMPKSDKPISITPCPAVIDTPGPSFRPMAMGKPAPDRCLVHEAVSSCGGLPLGWLTWFRC